MNSIATPQDAGMSADQLERAFGVLTAATEAGANWRGIADSCAARQGSLRPGMRARAPSHRPDSRCGLDISPRLNHQAGYCLRADDPRRSGADLTQRPGHRLSTRIHRRRPPYRQSSPLTLAHITAMPDMLPENTRLRQAHTPVAGFVERALQTPLLYKPGTDFCYQSMGILLAAEIVERVSGQRLRDFEREEIFAPLGNGAKRTWDGRMDT